MSGLHELVAHANAAAPAVGWMLKEIRVAGIDVTDRPLAFDRTSVSLTDVEVVLTIVVALLTGVWVEQQRASAAGVCRYSP